ncbi:MAG TPA: antibiotic biosynthesis monooxygenase [Chloroflexia bacterium]|nr:antibiotic biosynthesis monooxygenase [Chloroflexia bacterium]
MYISITTLGLEQSKVAELTAFYEHLLPALQNVKGWRRLYLLVNRETGEGKILVMWDTEADAYAFESSGNYRAIISQLQGVLSGPVDREVLEVVLQASSADERSSKTPRGI